MCCRGDWGTECEEDTINWLVGAFLTVASPALSRFQLDIKRVRATSLREKKSDSNLSKQSSCAFLTRKTCRPSKHLQTDALNFFCLIDKYFRLQSYSA